MKDNKILISVLVVVAMIFAGWYFYNKSVEEFELITDEGEMSRFVMNHSQEELDEYYRKADELKAQDTFGGKTPEETLELYIDALKEGDMELASKYFRLEDQEGELGELSELDEDQISKALKFIDVEDYNIFCGSDVEKCEINVFFENENILISRMVKVEQSELWKLESI